MSSPRRKLRFPAALLWLGVLAIVLHTLAAVGHIRPGQSADGLIEICTPQGMVSIDPATGLVQAGQSPQQGDAQPRCCVLCAACAAPAIASCHLPAPCLVAFAAVDAQAPPFIAFFPAEHPALTPLVPRGPPAHA